MSQRHGLAMRLVVFLLPVVVLLGSLQTTAEIHTYRAAAVEFAPERAQNASMSPAEILAHLFHNLNRFEPFIAAAADDHTQMIVLPEYGITGDGTVLKNADVSREIARKFGEAIPTRDETVSLCGAKGSPVSGALACMAQQSTIGR